ncbi:MAG: hypothetical protein HY075_00125 [Deltaproteobacteria bacterium]|nr:hypothetical protein [Deltaproteobacteria bacterium]
MKSKILVLLTAALSVLAFSACDECEKAATTINDLGSAKTLLDQGLALPGNWTQTCDTLVRYADTFRSDADFVRSVANTDYRGIPAGCVERGYVEYCHGGWVRRPWGVAVTMADSSTMLDDGDFAVDFDSSDDGLSLDLDHPGHGGGGHPGGGHGGGGGHHPSPGHPHPGHPGNPGHPGYPGHHYPPHYPRHPRWDWGYENRWCEIVPVCLRWQPGVPVHPGYEHVMSIAYELDQAAGGIESACRKAFEGAPAQDVNTIAEETRTRIEKNALPGANFVYQGLGCNARRGD